MAKDWYLLSKEALISELGANPAQGLDSETIQKRLTDVGLNELIDRGQKSPWRILWEQLSGFLTLILIAAAVISLFVEEPIDAIVILAIVILNAALGFSQEYKAEQSMAALKRLSVPIVRVRRSGRVEQISARDLVPGDIVLLETGNVVPADGRVLEGVNLRVQEAALTGESEPVDKDASLVIDAQKALGDRRNMVYMGTIVSYGHGEIVITETGMRTELGHIADLIQGVGTDMTPLQRRLDQMGKLLALAAIGIVTVIFLLGVLRGENLKELLLTSVSLAVAAIPEALTAVVTIALSLGAQRMLRRQALIRKLPAVETLGSVSVICSDKTGTLTLNQMTVTALDIANHKLELSEHVGSDGLQLTRHEVPLVDPSAQPTLDLLLVGGALCNDATLVEAGDTPYGYRALGDPTEGALILSARLFKISKGDLDRTMPRVAEIQFDSVRKRMTTVHRLPRSEDEIPESLLPIWERRQVEPPPFLAITKGAIDGLLQIADRVWIGGETQPLDENWRTRVMEAHDSLAQKGMRVLGVALKALDQVPEKGDLESLECNLILLGLFGMIDPPRPEVRDAVDRCKAAGIRPVMITGDHPLTARHIAKQLGISQGDRFLTGQEIDNLPEEHLPQTVRDISVFARVSPEHKLRLIQAFQDQKLIVAMTGDGVNDAPALKKADIGVAMGITGTDVAKEAADMVLLDDNFATIVAAVEEGRVIYDNIRKFIKYLLSCNASEIAVMLIGPFLGMPMPLLPLQILWMNLVTDGLPALALGIEPAEKSVMKRPPYSSTESVFGRGAVPFILSMGLLISLVSVGVGVGYFQAENPNWQTILFTTMIFSQLALALSVRSEDESLFKTGLFTNRSMIAAVLGTIGLQIVVIYLPFFQGIFNTTALKPSELLVACAVSILIWVVVEIQKLVVRSKRASEKKIV